MAWRETFLRWFGPGMLGGVTFGDWLRLLRDNRFDVAPRALIRAALTGFNPRPTGSGLRTTGQCSTEAA